MPIYQFRCRGCGHYTETKSRDLLPCPTCGDLLARIFSFAVKSDTPGHFNHSVGKFVSNNAQFREELKRKSDADSARFGTTVSYAPIDYSDRKSLGVTSEGLAETKARRQELGWKPLKSLEGE